MKNEEFQAPLRTDLRLGQRLSGVSQGAQGQAGPAAGRGFEFDLEANLVELRGELQEKTYRPGAYTSFYIHEPKRRLISAAPFRDRVVHHALCNVIEPIFDRSFIFDSYANRVGKGTHAALDRCQEHARRYRYVLQCDVKQFFPSLDLAILRDTLARKLADLDVLWLIDGILASGVGVLAEEYDDGMVPRRRPVRRDAAARPADREPHQPVLGQLLPVTR